MNLFALLRHLRDPIRVPRIGEIGSLQVHTRYLTFSFKKTCYVHGVQTHTVCTMQIGKNRHSRTINFWRPAAFADFRKKNTETQMALRRNFSRSVGATDLVEASKDATSLPACTGKILFGGCGFFVSDIISGELLGNLGPLYLTLGANR